MTNAAGHSRTDRHPSSSFAAAYGYLGGSLSDYIVTTIARALNTNGYRTVRFNSRGVGKSGGKGSWTGEVEGRDYEVSRRKQAPL